MNFDYNAFGTWVAVTAALIAIIAIWMEGKRSRFSQGLDILISKNNQFNREEFKETRRRLGKILEKRLKGEELTAKEEELLPLFASDVLDHFQGIGMLMRKGILDKELTHSDYSYWVFRYWTSFQFLVLEEREDLPFVWEDAEWLYEQLLRLEKKYRKKNDIPDFTKDELVDFYHWESTLY